MTHLGKEVAFDQPGEIIQLGGPWAGTLMWGGEPVTDNVLIDSLVADERSGRFYFVRCDMPTRWRRDVTFQVGFVEGDLACAVGGYASSKLPVLSVGAGGELYAQIGTYEPRQVDTSDSSCRPIRRP